MLGHVVVLFVVFFEEPLNCFPQRLHQLMVPPRMREDCLVPRPSQHSLLCVLFDDSHSDRCVLFDDSHSDRCEVTSHCGFDFHFSDDR